MEEVASSGNTMTINHAKEGVINILLTVWDVICNFVYDYKIVISVFAIVLLLASRFIIANALRVNRNDKRDWIIWGILMFVQLIDAIFVKYKPAWLVVQITVIAFVIFYIMLIDNSRQVKSTIYSSNIIYEDNSDKYGESDAELEKVKKARDGKIKRRWAKSGTHKKYGIPVFTTKYIFRVSTMATEEQLSKCVSYLNRYYDEYNWMKNKQQNGVKVEIVAELKTNTIMSIDFNKEISDELDWYVVPLGAIDVSNKKTAEESPYVWMMHDPKKEGRSYDCLKKTKTYPPAPQGFIVGQTGGGKSVLINTIIAHFINKAKQSRQTELYLCDAKHVEFAPYECLEEVAGCAFNLEDAVDVSNRFVKAMLDRNDYMARDGIKDIPLDGHVQLQKSIDINGHIIANTEIIEYKTSDGKIHKDYALNLKDKEDIIEVNIPDNQEEEEDDDGPRW